MMLGELKRLGERASTVEGRSATRLDEVRVRIRTRRRRRQLGAVSATFVGVALALTTGVSLLALTEPDRTPPALPAPRPTATPGMPEDKAPSVRRLTYAEGNKIHWGDRVIDVGARVSNLAATDDGVVFVSGGVDLPQECRHEAVTGGCDYLWFTDGSQPVRIGTVSGTAVRGFRLTTSTIGSTLVWFDPAPHDRLGAGDREQGEYVAYDTSARREVGRFGSDRSTILAVHGSSVYWLPDDRQCLDFYGECYRYRGSAMRFDASTGEQVPIQWTSYKSARGSWARTLVTPQLEEIDGGAVVTPTHPGPKFSDTFGFRRKGNRLVGDDGSVEVTVRLARTGVPLRLRVPAGYDDVDLFFMAMWLDDDRVVLEADNDGSLLVCRLPDGRCRTVVKGPVIVGLDGRG